MKIPTFSRQSATTAEDDRPTVAHGSTVAKPDDATTTHFTTAGAAADTKSARTGVKAAQADVKAKLADRKAARAEERAEHADARARDAEATREQDAVRTPVPVAGPKPRASLLATLGLVLGVVAAMLVLSGPLLGYGIGVAVLALILSLSGVHATGRRHVAGKSDALFGMVLSLAAIVVGVLALTGSLSWLGTDMQPVTSVREWLDAQFVDRF